MANVLTESLSAYSANLKLVLFFSIPFIIAFAIPLLAPLPTFISSGAIFLRTASIFTNLNFIGASIMIIALFFSLLFISFAYVAINLIVKSRRTYLGISKRFIRDIEKYIGKIFILIIVYTLVLYLANVLGYSYTAYGALITAIIGFFGYIPIFYAPSAIIVDNKKLSRAVKDSVRLVIAKPQYFIGWLLLSIIVISLVDFAIIGIAGTFYSRYIALIVISLLVLPFFVILQAEAYMNRFPMLKL